MGKFLYQPLFVMSNWNERFEEGKDHWTAVVLGVLLGALARTRSQASGLTTMVAILLAALGGAWWPLEITPPAYQTLVKALPTTWTMTGFNDVTVRGQGAGRVAGSRGPAGLCGDLLCCECMAFEVRVSLEIRYQPISDIGTQNWPKPNRDRLMDTTRIKTPNAISK
jgi:hypothetical protein